MTLCFSIGAFLYGYENSFKTFFRITINAEFVFLIPIIIKIIWFSFFRTDYDLIDLKNFSPLSALDIAYQNSSELWYIYPLRLLNFFELAYWCILAYQLKDILNRDFAGSLGFVASTYGVGLLLWVIFVMFLTVSLT